MVWNLLSLVSSDKAIKLLKEWLYSDSSDSNEQPSAPRFGAKITVYSRSLRRGKWYFAL